MISSAPGGTFEWSALRVLGPYLAINLLDEALAVLVLLFVLADLLKLLDGEAGALLGDLRDGQPLVVLGLQGTEDGCLALHLLGLFVLPVLLASLTLEPVLVLLAVGHGGTFERFGL